MVVAIDHRYGCVGVLGVAVILAFLGKELADYPCVFDGDGDGRHRQHRLALAAYLAIDERHEAVHHKLGYLPHARFRLIHLLLHYPHVGHVAVLVWLYAAGECKLHGHVVGYDVLCGVEDVAVGYGFPHRVGVEGHPHRYGCGTAELAEAAQRRVARRGGEAHEEVFLPEGFPTLVEGVLQAFEEVDHLLVVLAGVGAVYLVDEEGHAHVVERLARLVDGALQVEEFLYVHHDDAALVAEGVDEGLLVPCLHEHGLVDVHVVHALVQLSAQLQAIHHEHDFVVGVLATVAVVLEHEGCPTDDVALAEAGGILHQQGIDILVVAVSLAAHDYLLHLPLRNAEGVEFLAQFVVVVVGVGLVGEHLADAAHDLVAAELLLGSGGDEPPRVGGPDACFLLLVVFIFIGDEVEVEYLVLYRLLGV